MRWADALRASPVGKATRALSDKPDWDPNEPNIVLKDPKFPHPKLFRADDDVAWKRLQLKLADNYDDWTPEMTERRFPPRG